MSVVEAAKVSSGHQPPFNPGAIRGQFSERSSPPVRDASLTSKTVIGLLARFFDNIGAELVSTCVERVAEHAEVDPWPLKTGIKNINDNIVNVDFAPSVAEADAILAKFGYVDAAVEAIAA